MTMKHIELAIHTTVHGQKDPELSCEKIAGRLGRGHQTLINKADPAKDFHIMGCLEMVAIMAMTGDYSVHRATGDYLASLKPASTNQKPLIEIVLDACKEHGDVVACVQKALGDGRFTMREKGDCAKEIDEAIEMLTELRQAVALHKDGLRSI